MSSVTSINDFLSRDAKPYLVRVVADDKFEYYELSLSVPTLDFVRGAFIEIGEAWDLLDPEELEVWELSEFEATYGVLPPRTIINSEEE